MSRMQHPGSRPQTMRLPAVGFALWCVLAGTWSGALLPGGAADAATSPPTAAPGAQPGAWQDHELEFQFVGFTTTYSCDGLESKLRLLLTRLGARPGFTVWAYGCARGGGIPDRFARARLKFATLQPASAEGERRSGCRGAGSACPGHRGRARWRRRRGLEERRDRAESPDRTRAWRLRTHRAVPRPPAATVHHPGDPESGHLRAARGAGQLLVAIRGVCSAG